MEIKEIKYLVPLKDLVNDCLDVFFTLEDNYCSDGCCYLLEVTTPQFLSAFMEREKSDFLSSRYPYISVSKLTDDIRKASIQSLINTKNDSYWLKLYHIIATLNTEDINELLSRKKQENIELNAEIEA
jgi:hypothetical protein